MASTAALESVILLLSPMVSGALLSMTTIEVIFFIDVVTAAMAVLTFAVLPEKCRP